MYARPALEKEIQDGDSFSGGVCMDLSKESTNWNPLPLGAHGFMQMW